MYLQHICQLEVASGRVIPKPDELQSCICGAYFQRALAENGGPQARNCADRYVEKVHSGIHGVQAPSPETCSECKNRVKWGFTQKRITLREPCLHCNMVSTTTSKY